jgi:hypothetical protein
MDVKHGLLCSIEGIAAEGKEMRSGAVVVRELQSEVLCD